MVVAYIGLGSNLDGPLEQVQNAVRALADVRHSSLAAISPWYRSKAVGPGGQADYINGVVALQTALPAEALLDALQTIENAQGRVRNIRWGARTLDLDLLLYGDRQIASERLRVPHPHLDQRNFVLQPLHDLAPALTLPDGRRVAELLAAVGGDHLYRLD